MNTNNFICDCNKSYKSSTWFKKHTTICEVYKTNWVIVKNKSKPPKVSFNNKTKFSYDDKKRIISMINDLYNINEKFKSLVFENGYSNIAIVKNIHYDNRDLHFNGFLYRNDKRTNILHFYINEDDEIYKLTELIDLI